LLAKNPAQRIQSAAQIKRHPWYKNMDWASLALKKMQPPFKINVKSIESLEHFDEIYTKIKIEEDSSPENVAAWQAFDNFDYAFQGV
jgi:hypothetical protein